LFGAFLFNKIIYNLLYI